MTQPDSTQEWMALARRAALEAGRLLRERQAGWNQVTGAARHDIKLRADREAEAVILRILLDGSGYPILAEESGELGAVPGQDFRWIVDPLDGTANYSRGAPLSAVSIALWRGDRPQYGVVYDFWRDELFHGGPGLGAFLGDAPIQVSAVADPGQAILATGFPANRDYGAATLGRFVESIQRFRKLRLLGTAALSLAYVACGRADAYMEEDIMLWDIAAGTALVEGAGGVVVMETSTRIPNACKLRAASCPALMDCL